jgi:hypothetical protein
MGKELEGRRGAGRLGHVDRVLINASTVTMRNKLMQADTKVPVHFYNL